MKLLHTADWHIGRTLNGFSLLDEQKHAFEQILQIAKDELDKNEILSILYHFHTWSLHYLLSKSNCT